MRRCGGGRVEQVIKEEYLGMFAQHTVKQLVSWLECYFMFQVVSAIGRHTHPSSVHNLFTFDYTRTLKAVQGGQSNGQGEEKE